MHVLGDGDRAVAVAHRRVDDVEQRHRRPAVRGADGVEQVGRDGHRRAGVAGADLLEGDAEVGGERVGGEPGEQLGSGRRPAASAMIRPYDAPVVPPHAGTRRLRARRLRGARRGRRRPARRDRRDGRARRGAADVPDRPRAGRVHAAAHRAPSAPGGRSRSAPSPASRRCASPAGCPTDGSLLCLDAARSGRRSPGGTGSGPGLADRIELRLGDAHGPLRALPAEPRPSTWRSSTPTRPATPPTSRSCTRG